MGIVTEDWSLKRLAWAFGCARAGSTEEVDAREQLLASISSSDPDTKLIRRRALEQAAKAAHDCDVDAGVTGQHECDPEDCELFGCIASQIWPLLAPEDRS